MIEQQGRVTRVLGETVRIRVGGQSGCPACDAGRGCGAGLFGRLLRRRNFEIDVARPAGAAAGQVVVLGIPEALFVQLVTRMYGVPLLAGLAGGLFSHYIAVYYGITKPWLDVAALIGILAAAAAAGRIVASRLDVGAAHASVRVLERPSTTARCEFAASDPDPGAA